MRGLKRVGHVAAKETSARIGWRNRHAIQARKRVTSLGFDQREKFDQREAISINTKAVCRGAAWPVDAGRMCVSPYRVHGQETRQEVQ